MKTTPFPLILTAIALLGFPALPCQAGLFTLTFEGLVPGAKVGDYYNGGAGGDYGIAFYTSDKAPWADGGVSYPNTPSGTMVLRSTETYSASTCMNVANGILGEVAIYYSAPVHAGRLEVWSGPDGTGNLLAAADLAKVDTSGSTVYDVWAPFSLAFDGTAHSVQFGANSGVAFDNIAVEVVPEPGSWLAVAFLVGVLTIRAGVLAFRVVHRRVFVRRRALCCAVIRDY